MKIINNLFIGAVAFVILISIALLTINKPEIPYELSQEETLKVLLNSNEMEISPEQLQAQNSASNLYLIDVRSPGEFAKGHIDGAINIPQSSILEEENLDFFKSLDSSQTAVLYGRDQIQAEGPWMILKQIGTDGIKILQGGYDYYTKLTSDSSIPPEKSEYRIEVPQFDFVQIVEETPGIGDVSVDTEGPAEIVPVRRKKKQAAAGGC